MAELHNIGERFRRYYTKEDGHRFRGTILVPPTNQNKTTSFIYARRAIKVRRNERLSAGDIFHTTAGEWFLCMDNGDNYLRDIAYKSFYLVRLDRELTWSRIETSVDPVTKIKKQGEEKDLGVIKAAVEFLSPEEDNLRIPDTRYRVLTNKPLQLKDKLDGEHSIQRVEVALGITIAYI